MWHCIAVTKMLDLGKHRSLGTCLVVPYRVSASLELTILSHFWELYPFLEQ